MARKSPTSEDQKVISAERKLSLQGEINTHDGNEYNQDIRCTQSVISPIVTHTRF